MPPIVSDKQCTPATSALPKARPAIVAARAMASRASVSLAMSATARGRYRKISAIAFSASASETGLRGLPVVASSAWVSASRLVEATKWAGSSAIRSASTRAVCGTSRRP